MSADGDATSDKNQDYQIVYGVTPKRRSQFIKSWDKMMEKLNVKGSRHLIATPFLNRMYNSSVIGVILVRTTRVQKVLIKFGTQKNGQNLLKRVEDGR